MIGRLKGILIAKQPPQLVIDISGVGYEVEAPLSTFYQLPELGKEVTLSIHTVIREDAHLLYGFYTDHERCLFRYLIKINGVGPKLALTILSGIEPEEFVRCINNNDVTRLVQLPGVGKKTAERLLIEMRDKISDLPIGNSQTPMQINTLNTSASKSADAVSALIALGYKPQDASRMVSRIDESKVSLEELIRLALKGEIA